MRLPHTLTTFILCGTTFASNQEYFGSFNGLKGDVTCQNANHLRRSDALHNMPRPSGVIFQRPLISFTSGFDSVATCCGPLRGCEADKAACVVDKAVCAAQEQAAAALLDQTQQAHLNRQQELQDTITHLSQQLRTCVAELETQLSMCSQEKLDQKQELSTQLDLCRDTSAQNDLDSASQIAACKAKQTPTRIHWMLYGQGAENVVGRLF
ncbi:hypothetical protein DM02DRAFT_621213 [Periconia macrospinosa]|uniref:Uncharacterized protein n=1 Tax=Periconia macrospinosa TaxID=97972 RepID=A0A2V1ECQ3_9PLEO|nr:hypothetical protein DM02DRAFT_621213 [Periconia macrospinosa]